MIHNRNPSSELKMVDKFGLDRKRYGLLLYNDGTVCGGNFDQNAADAFCSLLEYANIGSKWESENRWSIQFDYRIAIENVNCRNNSWSSCTYSESYNCDHNEDVFLSCSDGSPGDVSIYKDTNYVTHTILSKS